VPLIASYLSKVVICLITILLVVALCEKFCPAQETQPKTDAVKVKAIKVGMSSPKSMVSGMGSISCPRTVELGFDDNGVISEILVEEGDPVREGQVIAKLDSSVLEAEKRATEARLAAAEAELKFNRNELDKKESLFAKNAVSDTDLKKAALEVDKSKASIEYIRAEILTAEAKLKRRILHAPTSGLVAQKHVEVGSVIMPNSNKVITLIQCSKAFAEIELGEKLFSVARPGMTVTIKVDALENQTFEGRLVRVAPQIDKKNRTFVLKVEIDNSQWLLRPGMFARADIDISAGQTLWVPKAAVQGPGTSGAGSVFVVKDGLALRRNVQAGKTSGDKVEIVKGLKKGELVIIQGHDSIADLDEVSVELSEDQMDAK
jgi:membrane fusion protein, multidrug efflux system